MGDWRWSDSEQGDGRQERADERRELEEVKAAWPRNRNIEMCECCKLFSEFCKGFEVE